MQADKVAIFLGDTYRVICDFPDDARRSAGYQIRRVPQGKEPDDWKSLPIVGANAFQKKTQKTPRHEIDKARVRLSEYLARGSR